MEERIERSTPLHNTYIIQSNIVITVEYRCNTNKVCIERVTKAIIRTEPLIIAHLFLYGTKPTKTIKNPDPSPANSMQRSSIDALYYNQLQTAPQGLLPTKSQKPTHRHQPTTTKHPPLSPKTWAYQLLALKISTFLAHHLQRSLVSAHQSLHSKDSPTLATLGHPSSCQVTIIFVRLFLSQFNQPTNSLHHGWI
jgi:hypothetical protein